MRFEPRTLVDTSRQDRGTEAETLEGPDLGMACASDDPRRGGKTKHTSIKETEAGPSMQTVKNNISRSREVSANVYTMSQTMRSINPDMKKSPTKCKAKLKKRWQDLVVAKAY